MQYVQKLGGFDIRVEYLMIRFITGVDIAVGLKEYTEFMETTVDFLEVIGSDGTNTNTGWQVSWGWILKIPITFTLKPTLNGLILSSFLQIMSKFIVNILRTIKISMANSNFAMIFSSPSTNHVLAAFQLCSPILKKLKQKVASSKQ